MGLSISENLKLLKDGVSNQLIPVILCLWKESNKKYLTVSIDELALSNMYKLEALGRILVKNGIISRQELFEEVQQVQ